MSKNTDCERFFSDLSSEELNKLATIKTPDDLKSVEVLDTWRDDHETCVGVRVNGIEFGCWWIVSEFAGAFYYWDSARAKADIVEYISQCVEDAITEKQVENDE
jgi:hypothetical protein